MTDGPIGAPDTESGFSLLEILVVLAIMSVVISLMGVRLGAAIESASTRDGVQSLRAEVQRARLDTLTRGRPLVLFAGEDHARSADTGSAQSARDTRRYEPRTLPLPEGWRVQGAPMLIDEAGRCAGTSWRVTSNTGRDMDVGFRPGDCRAPGERTDAA